MSHFDEVLVKTDELHKLTTDHMTWLKELSADGQIEAFGPTLWVVVQTSPSQGFERQLEVVAIEMPFNTAEEKRSAMRLIAKRYTERMALPVAVVFSSEAWFSKDLPDGMEPKDDAFRTEKVIAVGMTAEREMCMSAAPITRVNGRISPLEFGPLNSKGVSFHPLVEFYTAYAQGLLHRRLARRN